MIDTNADAPRIEVWNAAGEKYWEKYQRVLIPVILLFLLTPIWVSIGDHGFNGRSDARYAVVSMDMARTGNWIVPHYLGRVHLTKPPLMYWLESASIYTLGQNFFAVRLPSAISGTLSLLLLYRFAREYGGVRVGLFSAGLYAVMPLTILPARMTVTDSTVNLFWMLIVFSGYLGVQQPNRKRWAVIFWVSASLGMLAKGPVLLIPIGLVGVWRLILSQNRSDADETVRGDGQSSGRVGPVAGFLGCLLLSMIPTLLWAYAVYMQTPEAINIWVHETVDRAAGSGDHAKPFWFFIPILLVGCFPASAMLLLPGVNLRWKDAWKNLRDGSLQGYLGWAVIAPFVVYSLITGKLASYILPLCAPLALLSAMMLEQWFRSDGTPDPGAGRRIPEVRWGMFIGTLLFALGIGGAIWMSYGLIKTACVLGIVFALVVAGVLVRRWNDQRWRVLLMAAFLASWVVGWSVLEELEDIVLGQMSYIKIARETFGEDGWQGPVGVYQLEDGMIYWDQGGHLEHFETPSSLADGLKMQDEPILILTTAQQWDRLADSNPDLHSLFQVANQWHQWPGAPTRYLLVSTLSSDSTPD